MKVSSIFFFAATIVMFLTAEAGFAQITTISTYKNLITTKESRADLQGSPYLYPEWRSAVVKFGEGVQPKTENIKYDLLEDLLVVKGSGDEEYTFTEAPKAFEFPQSKELYKNGFAPVEKYTDKTFYQVIYDGKVKYLKKLAKNILESKGYNSATVDKKVVDETTYYLAKEDLKPVKVKASEKSVIAILGKGEELSKYLKENKVDLKSNEGMIALLTYYDGLK